MELVLECCNELIYSNQLTHRMTLIYLTSWEALTMNPNKKQTKLIFLYLREPVWTFPTMYPLCRFGKDFWLPPHHVDFNIGPVFMHFEKRLLHRFVESRMNHLPSFPKEIVVIFIIFFLSLGRRKRRKKEKY